MNFLLIEHFMALAAAVGVGRPIGVCNAGHKGQKGKVGGERRLQNVKMVLSDFY